MLCLRRAALLLPEAGRRQAEAQDPRQEPARRATREVELAAKQRALPTLWRSRQGRELPRAPAQIRTGQLRHPTLASGNRRQVAPRPVACGPAPVPRLPGPVPGTCFAGPLPPWPPSLALPAPRRITPLCSSASLLYSAHAKMRKLAGRIMRKLSVIESAISPHRLGTSARRKWSIASANSRYVG